MKPPNYKLRTIALLLSAMGFAAGKSNAVEQNVWPFWIGEGAAPGNGSTQSWTALGPLFFGEYRPAPEAPHQVAGGFRPLCVEKKDPDSGRADRYFLYPLLSYRSGPYGSRWSLFSLANQYESGPTDNAEKPAKKASGFDLWPVYFSRETGDPATSYRAVMPIYGTIYHRFGLDRLTWIAFPFYAKAEKRHVTTTAHLWPFFRSIEGEGNHGFTFWPLFGSRAKEGAYKEQFYLWPLIYRDEHALWNAKPDVRYGVLPFYAREDTASVKSETYVWPFFGYTNRTQPYRYHEYRYLWPFFVQGRGDGIYVNRWGPFYTHSIRKGVDKTWVMWPLWRHQTWTESGLKQQRNQVLWFVYNSTEQRSATAPEKPAAHKTHLWPLVSVWDNGAGRKQVQALSLFASLFPYNEPIQLSYDPLFAIYQFDQRSPEDRRHSFFWNFITWRHAPMQTEFHLGPLLSVDTGAEQNRIAIGCGLAGMKRESNSGTWKPFFFDFKRRTSLEAKAQP